MILYCLSFLWGIYILFSLIGWGALINRILFSKCRVDWGQRSAWGLAFSICLGGFLNLVGRISTTTIILYLLVGFLYCFFDLYQNRQYLLTEISKIAYFQTHKVVTAFAGIVALLFLLTYAGWVYSSDFPTFKLTDDYQAYFVFPNKMLQIGSMGADPFNTRRLESSLGGQSFLHTFVLVALGEANLNIIDPGISLLIAAGILLGYFREKPILQEKAIFLLFFLLSCRAFKLH